MQCLGVGGLGGGRGVWPRGVPPTGSRHRWKVSWWSPISPFLILPPLSTLPLPAPPVQYVSLSIFNEVNMDINIALNANARTPLFSKVLNVFGHWLISGVPVFLPPSSFSTAAKACLCVFVFLCLCVYVSVCLCLLPFCVNFRCSCVLAFLLSLYCCYSLSRHPLHSHCSASRVHSRRLSTRLCILHQMPCEHHMMMGKGGFELFLFIIYVIKTAGTGGDMGNSRFWINRFLVLMWNGLFHLRLIAKKYTEAVSKLSNWREVWAARPFNKQQQIFS